MFFLLFYLSNVLICYTIIPFNILIKASYFNNYCQETIASYYNVFITRLDGRLQ